MRARIDDAFMITGMACIRTQSSRSAHCSSHTSLLAVRFDALPSHIFMIYKCETFCTVCGDNREPRVRTDTHTQKLTWVFVQSARYMPKHKT